MSTSDTNPSSQSDIDEIDNLITSYRPTVRPPSPPRASIPISTDNPPPSRNLNDNISKSPIHPVKSVPSFPSPAPPAPPPTVGIGSSGFGSTSKTLTEPVWDTIQRDLSRIFSNLQLVVFPNPYREDLGKSLRDWDLWGPFFFIVFLGLVLSWSASVEKSEVFAVAFALLAAGAVVLTLNVLLLGGHIIFFQSVSLLGYCLFPLDIGALLCMLKFNLLIKLLVVGVALGWSSWAAYPFMSNAVSPSRKALAVYPVLLMYVSVGFLIMAID